MSATPEQKAKQKAYRESPEGIAAAKAVQERRAQDRAFWRTPGMEPCIHIFSRTPEQEAARKAYIESYKQTPEAKARAKACRQTPEHKSREREYRQTPEQKAKRRAYRQTPEQKARKRAHTQAPEQKARKRDYMQAPKQKAKQKEYRGTPEGKANQAAHNGRRRAIKRAAPVGDIKEIAAWLKCWKNSLAVHCHWCGGAYRPDQCHADHVMPLALGGHHSRDNLVIACAFCNLSKCAKRPDEWVKEIPFTI